MGIYGPSGLLQRGSQARNLLCKPTRPLKREQLPLRETLDQSAFCSLLRTDTGTAESNIIPNARNDPASPVDYLSCPWIGLEGETAWPDEQP